MNREVTNQKLDVFVMIFAVLVLGMLIKSSWFNYCEHTVETVNCEHGKEFQDLESKILRLEGRISEVQLRESIQVRDLEDKILKLEKLVSVGNLQGSWQTGKFLVNGNEHIDVWLMLDGVFYIKGDSLLDYLNGHDTEQGRVYGYYDNVLLITPDEAIRQYSAGGDRYTRDTLNLGKIQLVDIEMFRDLNRRLSFELSEDYVLEIRVDRF